MVNTRKRSRTDEDQDPNSDRVGVGHSSEHPPSKRVCVANQDTSSASDGFSFYDMLGKMRFFDTHLSDFIVPVPLITAPEILVHFVALYVIRNESKRVFPREVQLSWLTDFCISQWLQQTKVRERQEEQEEEELQEQEQQEQEQEQEQEEEQEEEEQEKEAQVEEQDEEQEQTPSPVPFSEHEHEAHKLSVLFEKRFLLFPVLAENCYSLVAIERVDALLEVLKGLVRFEADLPAPVVQALGNETLSDRVKRFKGENFQGNGNKTAFHHLDWNAGKHDKLRDRLHSWLAQLCFSIVRGLRDNCTEECLDVYLRDMIVVNVPKIPDPPKEDCYTTPWKVIQYLLVMLHEPEIDPNSGKLCSSERDMLLQGSLRDTKYGDIQGFHSIAKTGIDNFLTAKKHPQIDPYPGLWGTARASLMRSVTDSIDIVESEKVILRNCLPVVLEFGLKAVDDYMDLHRDELERFLAEQGYKDNEQGKDSAVTSGFEQKEFDKKDSLRFALSRDWACKKLGPMFEKCVLVERHGLKPRQRPIRYWKSVLDHVSSFPPYQQSAHIFRTMRSFPDSISVCLGLDYLHGKEHRLFFHQCKPPNLRHGERPWKLFDFSSKNQSRLSHWYERQAWGRMQEAGVVIFAMTEFIFRCTTNNDVRTDSELASMLRLIQLHNVDHESAVIRCPVNLRDIVHHVRSRKETVEQYKLRITRRLTEAAEATRLAINCSSSAFRKALIPFATTFAVRRGVKGLSVALCKLPTIPDNMLDLLWENLTNLLKDILQKRAAEGSFSFSGSEHVLPYDIEAQLTRLFRAMNGVFVQSAQNLLKNSFSRSSDELRDAIASFELRAGMGGHGKKRIKLRSLPSQNLWSYVESRYSLGYLASVAIEGGGRGGRGRGGTAAVNVVNQPFKIQSTRMDDEALLLIPRESERVSPLQVLSSKGISGADAFSKQWEEETSRMTPLPDPSLAMQTESVACFNESKMNFAWSVVTALSCILQRFPGHVQSAKCFTARHRFCPRNPSILNNCLETLSEIGEDVARTWCLGYGVQSLQTQSVFVRFDALMSAAFQIVGTKEFGCRPSIDANMCELDDERRKRGNQMTEDTAFMGHPIDLEMFDHDHPPYGNRNDFMRRTKWRGVVLDAKLQNLVHPEQAVQAEPATGPVLFADRRRRKVQSVDYLHLRRLKLPQPQVHKLSLEYFLEIPGVQAKRLFDSSGMELNFRLGDVFWFSMISVGRPNKHGFIGDHGYAGVHLGVMMEEASTKMMQYDQGSRRDSGPTSVHKTQVAAILFLPSASSSSYHHDRNGFPSLLLRMMKHYGNKLRVRPNRPGDQVIRLIPTGLNIASELSTVNVTFRRKTQIPCALNLAAVHPRLLQMHTQKLLTLMHRSSSKADRLNGIAATSNLSENLEDKLQDVRKVVEALYPRLEPEQLQAVSIPLLWCSLMRSFFFDSAGNPNEDVRSLCTPHFPDHKSMEQVGANAFFIRGPPGTGKSSVITSLVCAGLFGHESEHDVKGLLPTSIKRILVVTHTNAAIDDVLKKISKMRSFEDGKLVRVGLRGRSNEHFTAQRVYDRKVQRERKRRSQKENVNNRRVRFPDFNLFEVINDASVVFSTFGSLQRREFLQARSPFDMVIIEEAGKLHEGDITLGLAQSTGMKDSPKPGHPLAVIQVGDESQLPPHSSLDPNLKSPWLCADPFFKRYVSTCERVGSPGYMDFNYPVTLLTQHRAHRSIANVYSHYAYKGIIRTGARESWLKWKADDMDGQIENSNFKFRTVSIVSYDGSIYSDMPGNASGFGGNTNEHEYRLIVNICKDWCSRSRKFDNRITILSPYNGQVAKIRSMIEFEGKRENLPGLLTVQVLTVDSSQGLENDIVILSLVRTRQVQKQAFMNNPFRINVMLSRARERLIIVGAKSQLSSIAPNWKRCYDIIDALALQEQEQQNIELEDAGDSEPETSHYASYEIVGDDKVHMVR